MNEKVYKETHADLVKRGIAKINYGKYVERIKSRDMAVKKQEFEDRKIRLR
jgi:hypothetical protein